MECLFDDDCCIGIFIHPPQRTFNWLNTSEGKLIVTCDLLRKWGPGKYLIMSKGDKNRSLFPSMGKPCLAGS